MSSASKIDRRGLLAGAAAAVVGAAAQPLWPRLGTSFSKVYDRSSAMLLWSLCVNQKPVSFDSGETWHLIERIEVFCRDLQNDPESNDVTLNLVRCPS